MRRVIPHGGQADLAELDPSWPLAHGLVFAASNADGELEGSKDLTTGIRIQSGRMHAGYSLFGRSRNRTDASSQYVWMHRTRVNVGTGNFTAAAYYIDYNVTNSSTDYKFLFTNGNLTSSTQWRLMPHYNGSTFQLGSFAFFTFDGSVTQVATTGVVESGVGHWYIGVRRGTTLEIWRDNKFITSNTGTVRDVTGSNANPPQQGLAPSGGQCTEGNHGPALLWNRALTPTEITQLVEDSYGFELRPIRRMPFRTVTVTNTLKTAAGLADASIKTFAGLAKASTKTALGLTP